MKNYTYPLNTTLFILRKEMQVFQIMLNQMEEHEEAGIFKDLINDITMFTGLASDMLTTAFGDFDIYYEKQTYSEVTRVISNLFIYMVMVKRLNRDDLFIKKIEEWRMTLVDCRDRFDDLIHNAKEFIKLREEEQKKK